MYIKRVHLTLRFDFITAVWVELGWHIFPGGLALKKKKCFVTVRDIKMSLGICQSDVSALSKLFSFWLIVPLEILNVILCSCLFPAELMMNSAYAHHRLERFPVETYAGMICHF